MMTLCLDIKSWIFWNYTFENDIIISNTISYHQVPLHSVGPGWKSPAVSWNWPINGDHYDRWGKSSDPGIFDARCRFIINIFQFFSFYSSPHRPLLQIFHDVAYKAKDRSDLLAGIDEFLDQVTVLPPGEWDPSIRIEPPKNVPSQVQSFNDMKNIYLFQYFSWLIYCMWVCWLHSGCVQEKRKQPGVPNGTACQVEEELHAEHHGPELQRTGR